MSTTPYAPSSWPTESTPEGPNPLFAIASVLLGVLVVVLAFIAVFMWFDAHDARDAANRAASDAAAAPSQHSMAAANMGDLTSYAAAAPANAMDLAMSHPAYP